MGKSRWCFWFCFLQGNGSELAYPGRILECLPNWWPLVDEVTSGLGGLSVAGGIYQLLN